MDRPLPLNGISAKREGPSHLEWGMYPFWGFVVGFLKNDSPSLDKSSKDLRYGSATYSTSALSVEEVRSCVRLQDTPRPKPFWWKWPSKFVLSKSGR